MYEDHTVEEKYLHNFSPKEKAKFYQQQKKRTQQMAEYRMKVNEFIFSDSPVIFGTWPQPNTFLEIKYILNRIAANDPRDTSFELCSMDSVPNADKLALDIARAFRNNTFCKKVVLNEIGLTDNGILSVFHALKTKRLDFLDVGGNELTGESVRVLDCILSNPGTKWGQVNLGKIRVNPEQQSMIEKHKNLSFVSVAPAPKMGAVFQNLWQKIRQ